MTAPTYRRPKFSELLARLDAAPKRLTIVAGPRQVGKTTLVRQVFAELQSRPLGTDRCCLLSTDNPLDDLEVPEPGISRITRPQTDVSWLVRQWEGGRRMARRRGPKTQPFVLALDEIQKIPLWSETVKGLWDADQAEGLSMHVVLLGSSPLLVQRGLTESLTGRFDLLRLPHWSFEEMRDAFDVTLDEYLYFGGYPGAAGRTVRESDWRRYVALSLIEPSIEKDVFALNRVDKKALLRHLFRLGCDYSGQIFTLNKMAEHLRTDGDKAHTVTLSDYLELLGQAGLLVGLQAYSGNRLRLRASPPKFNVLNTALMSVETGYDFAGAKADRSHWGRLVESAVGAHLYNTGQDECRLYYWRKSPVEVDFVLERGRRLLALEVKSGKAPQHAPGLLAFAAAYPGCKTLVVGEGGVDLAEFLSRPAPEWLE